MQRFQINGDEERLELTMELGYQRILNGCLIVGFTFIWVTALAVLAVVHGNSENASASSNEWGYLNPRGNHFGFLWLLATLFIGALIPLYASKVINSKRVFLFDKSTGLFTHNGKTVTELRKIDSVKVRHRNDPDERPVHMLLIIYNDGFEEALDNWYDEDEMYYTAGVIGEFLRVPQYGIRLKEF